MERFIGVCLFGALAFLGLCLLDLDAGGDVVDQPLATAESEAEPIIAPIEIAWSEFSESDFLSEIDRVSTEQDHLLWLDREEIGEKAIQLLSANPTQATRLLELAGPRISSEQATRILDSASNADVSDLEFKSLQSHVAVLEAGKEKPAVIAEKVAKWLDEHGHDSMQAEQLAWLASKAAGPQVDSQDFSVSWSGTLSVPADGKYHLSVSPFDLSVDYRASYFSKQRTRVFVAGEQVLDTGEAAEEASHQTPELELSGSVDLRVEYECKRSDNCPAEAPSVIKLFWEGPGISKSLIPQEQLSANQEQGLTAVYRSGDVEVSQQDAQLDFVWRSGFNVAPVNLALLNELKLAAVKKGASELFQKDAVTSQELLSQPTKRELLSEVANDSSHLGEMSFDQVRSLYRDYRYDDPDQALEVLGKWLQSHTYGELTISSDFVKTNRQNYLELASWIHFQYPEHEELLHDSYLETTDGGCNLPVAYTLTIAKQHAGQLLDWTSQVDGKLKDAEGDSRSQWLLVRAFIDEIRRATMDRYRIRSIRHQIGKGWIQEADLVAESDAMKSHVKKEYTARLIADGLYEEAEKLATQVDDGNSWVEASEEIQKERLERKQLRKAISTEELRRHSASLAKAEN